MPSEPEERKDCFFHQGRRQETFSLKAKTSEAGSSTLDAVTEAVIQRSFGSERR
jgi:hypothetical protein